MKKRLMFLGWLVYDGKHSKLLTLPVTYHGVRYTREDQAEEIKHAMGFTSMKPQYSRS